MADGERPAEAERPPHGRRLSELAHQEGEGEERQRPEAERLETAGGGETGDEGKEIRLHAARSSHIPAVLQSAASG